MQSDNNMTFPDVKKSSYWLLNIHIFTYYYSLDRNAGRSLVETSHVTDQYYVILAGKK